MLRRPEVELQEVEECQTRKQEVEARKEVFSMFRMRRLFVVSVENSCSKFPPLAVRGKCQMLVDQGPCQCLLGNGDFLACCDPRHPFLISFAQVLGRLESPSERLGGR